MFRGDSFISVVARVPATLDELVGFVEQLSAVLAENYTDYEIVLITELGMSASHNLSDVLSRFPCVRIIRLSRRASDEIALTAGLEASIGDFVVVLNTSVFTSSMIPAFVDRARAGAHVVLGVPVGTAVRDSLFYRTIRRVYHRLTLWVIGTELPGMNANVFVFSRKAVYSLMQIRQKRRHLSLLLPEMGFPWVIVPYEPSSARRDAVRRPLMRSIRTGLSVLIEGSTLPLRLVGATGLLGSLLSIMAAGYVVVVNFIRRDVVEGWTTLTLLISGLFFLVFVMMALLGEYLLRVLQETTDRPLYYIVEERNSSVMLRDESRRNVFHASVDVKETEQESPSISGQRTREPRESQ